MQRLKVPAVVFALAIAFIACSQEGDRQEAAAPSFCPTHVARSLDVTPESGNTAPRAYYQRLSTSVDTPLAVTLYACDPDDVNTSAGLSWIIDSGPLSGTLSTTMGSYPDAVITYSPQRGFTGTDTFTYHVNDGSLDGNTAEISVAVNPAAPAGSGWIKSYGLPAWIQARDIDITGGGGYVLSGTSGWDIWAASLDPAGTLQWMTTMGDNNSDASFGVVATSDGGLVLTGQSYSLGPDLSDIFVVKLDSTGSVQWEKTFGTADQEHSYAVVEAITLAGGPDGYVVTGYKGNSATPTPDVVLLRLNSDGTVRWQRSYDGSFRDFGRDIVQTPDEGFIVAGQSQSFDGSDSDAWLIKVDGNGNILWQRAYGTNSPGYYDETVRSVTLTADGGYIIAGQTLETDPSGDLWILKAGAGGAVEWQKSYGGAGSDEAFKALEVPGGGYLVVGNSDSFSSGYDAWIMRLGIDGTVAWQWVYDGGGNDQAEGAAVTGGGGFAVSGYTDSFGTGNLEAWVLNLDSSGLAGGGCDLMTSPAYASSNTSATMASTAGVPVTLALTETDTSATFSSAAGTAFDICGP